MAETSIPGRQMDAAWRQAISEGLKRAKSGLSTGLTNLTESVKGNGSSAAIATSELSKRKSALANRSLKSKARDFSAKIATSIRNDGVGAAAKKAVRVVKSKVSDASSLPGDLVKAAGKRITKFAEDRKVGKNADRFDSAVKETTKKVGDKIDKFTKSAKSKFVEYADKRPRGKVN